MSISRLRAPLSRCARRGAPALALLLIASGSPLHAQDGALVTDRPDFTESATSVDPHRVQLEAGYTFESAGEDDVQTFGELLFRIGWTEAVELRLGLNSYFIADSPTGETSGLEDASIGIKIELATGPERPRITAPETALLVGTTLPTGSSAVGTSHLQPSLILALAWTLSEQTNLGANLGATWVSADGGQYVEGILSLALGTSLGNDWGGFVEYYTLVPESSGGETSHFADAGITRLLSNDFQLDLRIGTALGGETDFLVGAGVAYRW